MNIKSLVPSILLLAFGAIAQDATWIPASAIGAGYSDAKALRASPVTQVVTKFNETVMAGNPSASVLTKQLRDIFGDIENQTDKSLVAAIPVKGTNVAHFVAFSAGTFDVDAISAKLKADSRCKVATKDGVTVYSMSVGHPDVPPIHFALPRKGLIVMSDSVDTLLLGINTMRGKSTAVAPTSKIAAAISKAYPIVAVTDTTSFVKKGEKLPYLNTDMPSFVAFTVREKDEQSLIATVSALFASEAEAASAVTTLSGLKAITAMQLATKPEMAQIADLVGGIEIGNKGATAMASTLVNEQNLNVIFSSVGMLQPRQ